MADCKNRMNEEELEKMTKQMMLWQRLEGSEVFCAFCSQGAGVVK